MTTCPSPTPDLVALDVGGANIKAADGRGWTLTEPLALWREWQRLPDVLQRIVRPAAPRRIVATMTGEIADCYPSRAAGVGHIVAALEQAATAAGCDAPPGIYMLDGSIVPPAEALRQPLQAAASNWHALARLAAQHATSDQCLLVDVGSTTVDIVPIVARRPASLASDDAGRLRTGELVYTGVERTPVATIVRRLPHAGNTRPIAAEFFATSRDAWLLLGELPEDANACDGADGGPATADAARRRLARTMLLEADAVSADAAVAAAAHVAAAQARAVARALARVAAASGWRPDCIVLSGHGPRLAQMAIDRTGWTPTIVPLAERLGTAASRAAPAHALALIARGAIP
jgi:probable H4MPT-linked C1 transfer pathway protein